MSSDELRDAIAGALYVRDRFDSPTVVLADAILALPEMQTMLSKDAEIERLRAEMQQVRLDHITTLGELQEAAAEIEWLKEALTDAQNETRRG